MTPRYPWPVHPPLQQGEWLGGWLRRVAAANMVSLQQLLHDIDVSRSGAVSLPPPTLLASIAERAVCDPAALAEAASLPPSLLSPISARGEVARPFFGVQLLQVCPECLNTDDVPYIRRDWLDDHEVHCPRHGRLLLERCPHCGGQIRASFDLDKALRPDEEADVPADDPVKTCRYCRGDIGRPPGLPLLAGDILPARERFSRAGPEWASVLRAFERFVSTFGLFDLVHEGKIMVSPDPFRSQEWLDSRRHMLKPSVALSIRARAGAAHAGTFIVQGNVHLRLQVFARAAMIGASPAGRAMFSRPYLVRLWLLQAMLELPPRELRRTWPRLLEGAYALVLEQRVAVETFRLTDEQWAVIEDAVAPASNWNASNKSAQSRSLDLRTVLDAFLTTIGRVEGLTSAGAIEAKSLWNAITRLSDGAQLGFALGLLYRHLDMSMVEVRRRRGGRNARYDDWQLQTEALFLSDGMIELTRHLNPALHRELVGRVLLGRR